MMKVKWDVTPGGLRATVFISVSVYGVRLEEGSTG